MRNKLWVLLWLMLTQSSFAEASGNADISVSGEQAALSAVIDAPLVGRGTYRYGLWDIYEARLYVPSGVWHPDQSFMFEIEYFRSLNGKAIADRSVQEMRRQGFSDEMKLAAWHTQMRSIFPDVSKGSLLRAIHMPGEATRFFNGDAPLGSIQGEDFARLFFGIWLSEQTSAPRLRRALLGLR